MKRKLMLWCAPVMALTLLLSLISQAPTRARATAIPHPLLGHLHFLPHTPHSKADPPPTLAECLSFPFFSITCLGAAEFSKGLQPRAADPCGLQWPRADDRDRRLIRLADD